MSILAVYVNAGHRPGYPEVPANPAPIFKNVEANKAHIRGTKGVEVIDQLKPRDDEIIVYNYNPSSFCYTDLDLILRNKGVTHLVLSGIANSVTVRQTGVMEALRDRGNMLIDPISPGYGLGEYHEETIKETLRSSLEADVFLAGTNAVTEDGKLVNIDGVGNRVGGIIRIAGKSIIVIGRNKIVKNVDAAFYRIKNQVTPTLAKRRQPNLSCARAGRCVDCHIPERACNITVILEKKPAYKDLTVMVVDEDLGLGWDTEWPEERIDEIRCKYEQFDWPYTSAHRRYKEIHADR